MKKILSLVLLTLLLSLTACQKTTVENPYFKDDHKDHYDEFREVFRGYIDELIYYQTQFNYEHLQYEEDFVPIYPNKTMYRHELINYHLADDKRVYNSSGFEIFLENLKYLSLFDAEYLDEGDALLNDNGEPVFTYYMEDDKLFLTFTVAFSNVTYDVQFYAYNENYMDHIYFYFEMSDESIYQGLYVEDHYTWTISDSHAQYHDMIEGEIYDFWNILPGTYNDNPQVTFFDEEENEGYIASARDNGVYIKYQKYIRDTLLVSVDNDYSRLIINLSELKGWDKIILQEDSTNLFKLGYNETIISDYIVTPYDGHRSNVAGMISVQFDTKYDFSHVNNIDSIDEDIISLNVMGLESGFNKDMFDSKFNEIELNYDGLLERINWLNDDKSISMYATEKNGLLIYLGLMPQLEE